MSSNNLAIPQLTAGSAGKDVLVNDAVAILDGALTRTATIDASASSIVTFDNIKDAVRLLAQNTADKAVISLPATPHLWVLANDAASANTATFSVGSTTVKVGAGQNIVAYSDGVGLYAASGGSGSGGGGGGGSTPTAKRRYVRITASSSPAGNGSNGYLGLAGLTLATVPGGLMPSSTILSSSENANIAKWFDNDPTTNFERGSTNDITVLLDFVVPQAIVEVRALPIPAYSLEAPNTIKLEWSDNGTSFDPPLVLTFTFPDDRSTQAERTTTIAEYDDGSSGGGGGASALADLTDVDVSGATEGQVLTLTGGKWEGKTPAPSSGGGGGGGGGGSTDPTVYPLVADFAGYDGDPGITTGTSGQFQAIDDTDGLTLIMAGQSNGDRWKGLYRVIDTPAAKWSLRVHALLDYDLNGYACAPLIVYRDAGGTATVLGKNVAGNTAAVKMPRNGVGYNGNPYENAPQQQWEWFRVDFDGVDTLTWYASKSGKAWAQLFTQGANDTYGGAVDRFAVGIECNKPGDASAVSLKALTFTR